MNTFCFSIWLWWRFSVSHEWPVQTLGISGQILLAFEMPTLQEMQTDPAKSIKQLRLKNDLQNHWRNIKGIAMDMPESLLSIWKKHLQWTRAGPHRHAMKSESHPAWTFIISDTHLALAASSTAVNVEVRRHLEAKIALVISFGSFDVDTVYVVPDSDEELGALLYDFLFPDDEVYELAVSDDDEGLQHGSQGIIPGHIISFLCIKF